MEEIACRSEDILPHVGAEPFLREQVDMPPEEAAQRIFQSQQAKVPRGSGEVGKEIHIRFDTVLSSGGRSEDAQPEDSMLTTYPGKLLGIEVNHTGPQERGSSEAPHRASLSEDTPGARMGSRPRDVEEKTRQRPGIITLG